MISSVLRKALQPINNYIEQTVSGGELHALRNELSAMTGATHTDLLSSEQVYTYEELQSFLATLNEKETIRKKKGVYYTPSDVVRFILTNSVKLSFGTLTADTLSCQDLTAIPYQAFCYERTIFDPTCGSGVFLLEALELKFDLLDFQGLPVTKKEIDAIVSTIHGNDLNGDSIAISKLRLFLSAFHRYGAKNMIGLSGTLNKCFDCYDFVEKNPDKTAQYDVIVGNPPYVEDGKSISVPQIKYGNIYANVLENAALHLKPGGVLGFVIPLSYVSTPRMKKIRDSLYQAVPEQYLLSYSDRPDCLFSSVHQKLCIFLGKAGNAPRTVMTANYRYWYKEERDTLFSTTEIVKNTFIQDGFIPKLGTPTDVSIYQKVTRFETPILSLLEKEGPPLYLNMRATFWIKAFLQEHTGAEYKQFQCSTPSDAALCMCLLNSSLFWWYWICVSDCWHITRKELRGFTVPDISDRTAICRLAEQLETMLEETKVFVGTKQTEYEYKHKNCAALIHQIDDLVNPLYGLTAEESAYIKQFAYRYRISGGVENECN